MSDYNHYIRTENNIIIYGFSDAFEQPISGDIELTGDLGRHFQIQLANERGQYIYKWENGAMVSRTQYELDAEWNARPTPIPSETDRIKSLEDALLSLLIGG